MRDIYDQIYYPSNGNFQEGRNSSKTGSNSNLSNSSSGASGVVGGGLGKFLTKLAKSKSDVNGKNKKFGFGLGLGGGSSSSGGGGFDVDDDFRLTRPTLHNSNNSNSSNSTSNYALPYTSDNNSPNMVHKKDVGHSWIYGSPGPQIHKSSQEPQERYYPPGHHQNHPAGFYANPQAQQPTGYFSHRQPQIPMQMPIPMHYASPQVKNPSRPCHQMNGEDFSCCSCEHSAGGQQQLQPPLQPGQFSPYAIPQTQQTFYGTTMGPCLCHASARFDESQNSQKDSKLVQSVKKLTWKSLKAAVKKRPTLDAIRSRAGQNPPTSKEVLHYNFSMDRTSKDDLFAPPNYFFPDKKKSFFASCNDLLHGRELVNATASVRVRPKRSRSSWNFPHFSEDGPVPNYYQDEIESRMASQGPESLYHSEWDLRDLRQIMPYDLWITTSNKPNNLRKDNKDSALVSRKPSILDKEHKSAYQMLKKSNTTASQNSQNLNKKSSSEEDDFTVDDESGESLVGSDELSDNVLSMSSKSSNSCNNSLNGGGNNGNNGGSGNGVDDPTIIRSRVAGQGIYYSNNCNTSINPNSKSHNHNTTSNSTSLSTTNTNAGFGDVNLKKNNLSNGKNVNTSTTRSGPSNVNAQVVHNNVQLTEKQLNNRNNNNYISIQNQNQMSINPTPITTSTSTNTEPTMSLNGNLNNTNTSYNHQPNQNQNQTKELQKNSSFKPIMSSEGKSMQTNQKLMKSSKGQDNKYGVLRGGSRSQSKNKNKNKTNLMRETILEEEDSNDDQEKLYSVKIVVNSNEQSVKPILKKNPALLYDSLGNYQHSVKNNSCTNNNYNNSSSEGDGFDHDLYNSSINTSTTTTTGTGPTGGKKKVQFGQEDSVVVSVCGGGSETEETEEELTTSDDDIDEDNCGGQEEIGQVKVDDGYPPVVNDLAERLRRELEARAERRKLKEIEENQNQMVQEEKLLSNLSLSKSKPVTSTTTTSSTSTSTSTTAVNNTNTNSINRNSTSTTSKVKVDQNQEQESKGKLNSSPRTPVNPQTATIPTPKESKAGKPSSSTFKSTPPNSKIISSGGLKIINPNALLFHDTTRIRLNQSRPSITDSTFKLPPTMSPAADIISKSPSGGMRSNNSPSSSGRNNGRTSVKQSSSFRTFGPKGGHISTPLRSLRPTVPPPPPPSVVASTNSCPPVPKRTGSVDVSITNAKPLNKPIKSSNTSQSNKNNYRNPLALAMNSISNKINNTTGSSSSGSNSNTGPRFIKKSQLNTNSLKKSPPTIELVKNSATNMNGNGNGTGKGDLEQNIEIVTKDNSVSEIRIYSGAKVIPAQIEKNHHANGNHQFTNRPHSTSVVLIGVDDNCSAGNEVINNNNNSSRGNSNREKVSQENVGNLKRQLPPLPMSQPTSQSAQVDQLTHNNNAKNLLKMKKVDKKVDHHHNCQVEEAEPLYDDIISQNPIIPLASLVGKPSVSVDGKHELNEELKKKLKLKMMQKSPPQVALPQVPTTPKPTTTGGIVENDVLNNTKVLPPLVEEIYNDVGLPHKDTDSSIIYDDTLSLIVNRSTLNMDLDSSYAGQTEPIYDDVFNLMDENQDTDSGAETEDSTPPPLPLNGPPALPKASKELPLMSFPLLNPIKTLENPAESVEKITKPSCSSSASSTLNLNKKTSASVSKGETSNEVLSKTRSLLNELNERLSQLNFPPTPPLGQGQGQGQVPAPDGVNNPSSSESSGVEEDYNSDKNPSSSASTSSQASDNYNRLSKLVQDTISMARGKFLDSMKNPNDQNKPGSPVEEPIYEEIPGDCARNSSPIYSDAFDAKSGGGEDGSGPTSIFDGASRTEILTFLESIRDRLAEAESNTSSSPTESRSSSLGSSSGSSTCQKAIGPKEIKVERNDSGIGSEASSLLVVQTENGPSNIPLQASPPAIPTPSPPASSCNECHEFSSEGKELCLNCVRRQTERKEILLEVYETEVKYGRDLRIILDEFYMPIHTAGLLSKDQLDGIFLNVEQLQEINAELVTMLRCDFEKCQHENDDDLTGINVGRIFATFGERMMTAFEYYCTRQAGAGALLSQLEKEKELLRIFLRVSQMENTVLRRMNLPAFLMVPVQRVTRYPLLLSRLLKVTPIDHPSREELESAQEKIEIHLEHMNKTTREVSSVRLWRRISIINGAASSSSQNISPSHRRSSSDLDGANIRIRKMALDILEWTNFSDVHVVLESQLSLVVHMNGKSLKNIFGILLARGKNLESLSLKIEQNGPDDMFFPPADPDVVKDVKLVLVRVKNTRFCLLREPLCLGKCIVSSGEGEFQDFIEINEIITKNTYYIQSSDKSSSNLWLRQLQCHAMCVGQWRRRRPGLPNIMMNSVRHLNI